MRRPRWKRNRIFGRLRPPPVGPLTAPSPRLPYEWLSEKTQVRLHWLAPLIFADALNNFVVAPPFRPFPRCGFFILVAASFLKDASPPPFLNIPPLYEPRAWYPPSLPLPLLVSLPSRLCSSVSSLGYPLKPSPRNHEIIGTVLLYEISSAPPPTFPFYL